MSNRYCIPGGAVAYWRRRPVPTALERRIYAAAAALGPDAHGTEICRAAGADLLNFYATRRRMISLGFWPSNGAKP